MPTTGLDLRVKRVRARVALGELVKAIGFSRTTVWGIEKALVVSPEHVKRYLAALETCRDIKDKETAA